MGNVRCWTIKILCLLFSTFRWFPHRWVSPEGLKGCTSSRWKQFFLQNVQKRKKYYLTFWKIQHKYLYSPFFLWQGIFFDKTSKVKSIRSQRWKRRRKTLLFSLQFLMLSKVSNPVTFPHKIFFFCIEDFD